MTLLLRSQSVARLTGVDIPATIIGATGETPRRLLACASAAGEYLAELHDWVELNREYTFSTANGTANYALPADYHHLVDGTVWDRTNYDQLRGALTPADWQTYKGSLLANSPSIWKRYRLKFNTAAGPAATQIYLDPTPTSIDSLVIEYVSTSWCASSAGVAQSAWAADDDVGRISERLIELEMRWRFKDALGLAYDEAKAEAEESIDRAWARSMGPTRLSIVPSGGPHFLDWRSIPETGMG